ncbi:MAG: response regulator transcription factor [Chlorobiales bacterium]|jgi:two-component system, OmpR family, alkaline phosphatase synthesis response regulator PhoP|nr:response regulator transcription factor [Chlorobiales bacterium]
MNPRTILIADEELKYATWLRSHLEQEGYNVVMARNASETLARLSYKPEMILLDLMKGDASGAELCRQIRSMPESESLSIIMMSNKPEETDELLCLELGADDFLAKAISPRVLTARIKNVLKRHNVDARGELSYIKVQNLEVDRTNHTVRLDEADVFLPRKEFELLWLLATNRGKVFSREMLLSRIWGENIYVTERTVDVHICKVRQRLAKFGAEYFETIKGVGYRMKA